MSERGTRLAVQFAEQVSGYVMGVLGFVMWHHYGVVPAVVAVVAFLLGGSSAITYMEDRCENGARQ